MKSGAAFLATILMKSGAAFLARGIPVSVTPPCPGATIWGGVFGAAFLATIIMAILG